MEENQDLSQDLGIRSSGEEPIVADQQIERADPGVREIIIGAELTDEDREIVLQRLGRPENPEGYDLDGIVPESYNRDLVEAFKQKAYENGMSKESARKMAEWYKEVEMKHYEAMQKAKQLQADQQVLELKKEFGVRFDEEVKNARKALDAYTDKSFRQYMDESGLGNHPALVKAFAKIGRELAEDKLVQSETAQRLAKSEELRRSEILRLRSDPNFMARYRRGEPAAVKRMEQLYTEQ